MKIPYVFKKCSRCGEWKVANKYNFYGQKTGKYDLLSKCKVCCKEYNQSEKRKEVQKQYNHSDKGKVNQKKYKQSNKGKEANKRGVKKYYQSEKGKVDIFNRNSRRRQREENQGDGITSEQWKEMMDFFEWRCAYSGELVYTSKMRSIDHIVPVSKGGENEIWNIVPMYKNYNKSKNAQDMITWYKQQDFYSEERLNKINEWQEYAYNKYGLNDEII